MGETTLTIINNKDIKDCIYDIHGVQVMLDIDVAYFYKIETKKLNQQMRRNIERFPEDFCFKLSYAELKSLKLQSEIFAKGTYATKYNRYAYTEQGIMALSGVIKNDIAVQMSIKIVRTFISMRRFILENGETLLELAKLQNRQINFEIETNNRFDEVLKLIDKKDIPKQTTFFDGQYYDAYEFISNLIRHAKLSIIIIDSYLDNRVLTFLKNKNKDVEVYLYKSSKTKLDEDEINIFESEYGKISISIVETIHDRFLIVDRNECYSLGTSLNHAGKRTFAINKITDPDIINALLNKIDL